MGPTVYWYESLDIRIQKKYVGLLNINYAFKDFENEKIQTFDSFLCEGLWFS